MSWKVARVGDFCITGSGATPSRSEREKYYHGGAIPWVKSGELREKVILDTEEHVTEQAYREARMKMVPKGSILLAMYGATVGRMAMLGTDATTNQAVCHIVPDRSVANVRFIFHALQYKVPSIVAMGVGGAQPNINQTIVKNLEIPLPPLSEQCRIAAILDKVEALRSKRNDAIAKLDQLLKSVFLQMFGDPATNPKGWPIGKITDLLESFTYGSSEKAASSGDVPILRMNNITSSGEMNLTDLKYLPADRVSDKHLVEVGDVLFNRTNSKELVGKTAVYDGPSTMAYAGYLVRARPKDAASAHYISGFLNSSYGKATLRGMCKSIVGMANINAKEFSAIEIAIPPIAVQRDFASRVKAVRDYRRRLEAHQGVLDTLFGSLQERAFAGEL